MIYPKLNEELFTRVGEIAKVAERCHERLIGEKHNPKHGIYHLSYMGLYAQALAEIGQGQIITTGYSENKIYVDFSITEVSSTLLSILLCPKLGIDFNEHVKLFQKIWGTKISCGLYPITKVTYSDKVYWINQGIIDKFFKQLSLESIHSIYEAERIPNKDPRGLFYLVDKKGKRQIDILVKNRIIVKVGYEINK